jgi:PAP2 superfamily
MIHKILAVAGVCLMAWFSALTATAAEAGAVTPQDVLHGWYKLSLALVRHTPTYTPPVASRALAYLGVTAYESVASGSSGLQSLAGQLHGLETMPKREAGQAYDEAAVLQAAMAFATRQLFSNTGPTGQHAMAALETKLRSEISSALTPEILARSAAFGEALGKHVLAWSQGDNGAVVENMGFPSAYDAPAGAAHWTPTSAIRLQQFPLLPGWGANRPFAMPAAAACSLPPPPDYSEDKQSEFYGQALEVYQVKQGLTAEQRTIARFWSDDAMLSVTPPGHWIEIAWQIVERDRVPLPKAVDVLARLGIAEADAFIGCWRAKYQYDLLRPLTYIRRVIDPKWEPLLNTPPFPEYPSGHSTQSAAAAAVLTSVFGDNFAFRDETGKADGLAPRSFASFAAAANEAGLSRLFGGIHFRAAIEQGAAQGRCIAAYALALRTQR